MAGRLTGCFSVSGCIAQTLAANNVTKTKTEIFWLLCISKNEKQINKERNIVTKLDTVVEKTIFIVLSIDYYVFKGFS